MQDWIANLPEWIEVREIPDDFNAGLLEEAHRGEQAAIALAFALHADLLLMDDRKGVIAARGKGLRVTGTLGILELAAQKSLINFVEAIERLRQTNFRSPEALLDALLKRHRGINDLT